MKKNLLLLTMLIPSIYMYAQDTYIGSQAVVKVNKETLFYNGGNLTLKNTVAGDIPISQVVKNEGNIKINKAYHNIITDSKGEHFVNLYENNTNYGQVIINGSAQEITDGKLTMQKKSANSASIQQLPIAFPFTGNVREIMHSFTDKTVDNFRGNCPINQSCGQRAWMTLFTWNNNWIVNDAVTNNDNFIPGAYYLINIISNTGLNGFYNGTNLIGYKGIPTPKEVKFTGLKTVIPNLSESEFAITTYNDWKGKKNKYQEKYSSYLGNGTNDLQFGKNMFRFGNPFTSNLDLSIPNTWMTTPTNKSFELIKLTQGYTHTWNNTTGSSHNQAGDAQYITATYNASSSKWTGDKEAILVRPLEMLRIKFNENDLVTLDIKFNDVHKTFNQELNSTIISSSRNLREQSSQFHQLKISLVDSNDNIITDPVFLAADIDFHSEVDIFNTTSTMVLLEEDTDGGIIANAKSIINVFNDNYVSKPLNLELNGLPIGNQYKLRFNLKENNIFTDDVDNYSSGDKFYIHDKLNDTFTELNANSIIDINVTEQTKNQYAFYWKQIPRTLGTGDISKNFKTQVYKFAEDVYKIKLDTSKSKANIEIYSVDGRKVSTQNNINVSNTDELLKIPSGQSGLYIVKVVYNDGTQNNIKVLVD